MQRKCPVCHSLNVRRSSSRVAQTPVHHIFLSRYRCRDCRDRFWVISESTYYFVGIAAAAILFIALGWGIITMVKKRPVESTPAPIAAPGQAFTETVELAQRNDQAAQLKLARMYRKGDGVLQNDNEAWAWLERAAEGGNSEAQVELGVALRDGYGVIQDYEQAFKWLSLAAEAGNPDAQFELGLMYQAGLGVPVNNFKAYTWLNLAAARGVKAAIVPRNAVLRHLSPAQAMEAQAETRRLNDAYSTPSAGTPDLHPNAPSK